MKRKTEGEKRMDSIIALKNKRKKLEKQRIAKDDKYWGYIMERICPICGKMLADDEYSTGMAWSDGPIAFFIKCKACMFFHESYFYRWTEKCEAFHRGARNEIFI